MKLINDTKFQLIITVVSKGYSSDVVSAAKKAGATGGTIMHGRGSGTNEHMKFFGITIEPEKEVVLIVVDEKITLQVMESIGKEIDIDKPGNGICFTLDVTHLMGISRFQDKK